MINSIAGIEDIGAPLPYSSSKAALAMFAKGLSRKLAEDRIRVNTVVPGNILFPEEIGIKAKANPKMIQELLEAKSPIEAVWFTGRHWKYGCFCCVGQSQIYHG